MKFLTLKFSLITNSFLKFLKKKNSIKPKDEIQLPNTPFKGNRQKQTWGVKDCFDSTPPCFMAVSHCWIHSKVHLDAIFLASVTCLLEVFKTNTTTTILHSTTAKVPIVLLLCANSYPSVSCTIFPWQHADQTEAYPSVILTARAHAADNRIANNSW